MTRRLKHRLTSWGKSLLIVGLIVITTGMLYQNQRTSEASIVLQNRLQINSLGSDLNTQLAQTKAQLATVIDTLDQVTEQQFILLSLARSIPLFIPKEYRGPLMEASKRWNVPPVVLYVMIEVETGETWNPRSINRNQNGTIDRGLMQINSKYEAERVSLFWDKKETFNHWNGAHSIYLGAAIVADHHKTLKSWSKAIMAYNMGLTGLTSGGPITTPYLTKIQEQVRSYVNQLIQSM